MSDGIEVRVDLLRRVSQVLFDHLESIEGPTINLDRDYFWDLMSEQIYDVYNQPTEFTIGQLSESLGHLEALVADPDDAIAFALVWLAQLLRAIGEKDVS